MQELAHDERMRRLQQLVYGAVASDAERAAAAAELEALRRERQAPAAPADARALTSTEAGASAAGPAPFAPSGPAQLVDAAASARRFRWAIAAGTAALFLGVGVGWQLGSRTATPTTVSAEASVGILDGARLSVPVADTAVLAVFDRPATPADAPHGGTSDDRIAPEAFRLLLTRSDGVTVHAARVDGGKNVCVTVGLADGGTASSCSSDGRFPGAGLWVEVYVGGGSLLRGTLHADGTASITPSGYAVEVEPIANG